MTVRWVVRSPAGAATPVEPTFPSRAEAEAWLADNWARLAAAGAVEVTLEDGGDEVYTMSLEGS